MNDYFLSCDWGTSSFRLRLIRTSDLNVVHSIDKPDMGFGQQSLSKDQYLEQYASFCSQICESAGLNTIPNGIITGMASSSIGIQNLAYGTLPASLSDFKIPYIKFENHDSKSFLISGLATESDVMRGEEIQVLGAMKAISISSQNIFLILPGTHSKHIQIEGDTLTTFHTYLTGELFSILLKHSIIRHSVSKENIDLSKAELKNSFLQGVSRASHSLLNELFSIRARQILQSTNPHENYAFLSGLLIGSELLALKNVALEQLILCADQPVSALYSQALQVLYPSLQILLVRTEEATILGHFTLLQKIQQHG